MQGLKVSRKLIAVALAGLALAGCEANGGRGSGGGGTGGGGDGPQIEGCDFPYGPDSHVITFVTDDCANCSVENPENLIDSDAATFATVNVTSLGGGTAGIKASFDDPNNPNPDGPRFPAGNVAGLVLEVPGPLSASALPTFTIVTKLDNIVQEEFPTDGVVGANLLGLVGGGQFLFGATTTKDFDAVEFKAIDGLLDLGLSVNVYAACGNISTDTSMPYFLL